MNVKSLYRIALLSMISAVTACGFHLRGDVQLAQKLLPLHIVEQGPAELRGEIRSALLSSDIKLTSDTAQAASSLSILSAKQSRRVLSVDSLGRAREYEVDYVVHYSIKTGTTSAIIKTVKLSRDLIFDPDSVLALDYEIQTLYQDMRHDASRLILQQLQAVK